MAWERVPRLKTVSYGPNQPAAGNPRQSQGADVAIVAE
jgi:hypothetical protein